MEPVQPAHLALPDGSAVCRVLPRVTVRIDAPADVTCAALLAHAEQATEVLVCTAVDAQHVAGRWRAARQGTTRAVSCELIEGPLPGLLLRIRTDDLEGASTLLQIEGTYIGPSKPHLGRRRVQQLAEALRAGLARSLREAVAPVAGTRGKQRAAPRQLLALPIRLRVGDTPWLGVMRDISVVGLGLLVRATPQTGPAAAAQIMAHAAGAVEVLLGDSQLIAWVRITRARPWPTGIDVGLRYGTPDEGARLRRRLAELDRWRELPIEAAR